MNLAADRPHRGPAPPTRLSAVVPLFNCLALTQAMTASLRASLPGGLETEIILVDAGSTDGTREWLSSLGPPFRIVLNERNLGFAAACNRGAALASGKYLALLNNDLEFKPGWIEPMLEALRWLDEKAGIVGNVQIDAATGSVDHAGIFINHKGKPEHLRRKPWCLPLGRPGIGTLRRVAAMTGACMLMRRDLWRNLKGFDEGYVNGCEDVDLCFRAAALGCVNTIAVRSVVRHHVSAAPGRKARDEANTRRLVRSWRSTLVHLGVRDWCRNHFEKHLPEPRDFPDASLARQIVLYLLRLRRHPPQGAIDGMRAALDIELARWDAMLG